MLCYLILVQDVLDSWILKLMGFDDSISWTYITLWRNIKKKQKKWHQTGNIIKVLECLVKHVRHQFFYNNNRTEVKVSLIINAVRTTDALCEDSNMTPLIMQ